MISLQPEPGGLPEPDPAPKHTGKKTSMPDTSNQFAVCAKGDNVLVHGILAREPITMARGNAINLAAWLVVMATGEKDFWEIVEHISKTSAATDDAHKLRHEQLHRALDELLADWIGHTHALPSQNTVAELMKWSHEQTINPTKK